MLSLSRATVHRTGPKTPPEPSASPPSLGRQDRRSWNCEYTVFPKRRFRQSSARKKIISSSCEDATIGIDVHCQTVHFEQAGLESSLVDSADEVFAADVEIPELKTSSQRLQRISHLPLDESATSAEEKDRPTNPIPFVKSAQMQRNKMHKTCEIDNIEIIAENGPNTAETVEKNANIDNESTEKSADFKVVVVEKKFEDDDMESIFDAIRPIKDNKIEEQKEIEKIDDLPAAEKPQTRVLSSRMLRAQDLLNQPTVAPSVYQNAEEYSNDGVPGIPGDVTKTDFDNFPSLMAENDWDSDVSLMHNLHDNNSVMGVNNHERLDNRHFLDEIETNDDNLPYYMHGFPNPVGENRCWLNATLHAMFALPLIEHLENLGPEELRGVSELTKTFMALRLFWSKGKDCKTRTYQTIKTLKESLGILDESYPSTRQQDVSEFLTMFLNYLKTDFEKLAERKIGSANRLGNYSDETENVSDNVQNTRVLSRLPQTPTKRPPLADISPRKRKFAETGSDSVGEYSPKARKISYSVQDLLSPRINRLSKPTDPSYKVHTPPHHPLNGIQRVKENSDFCKNPIDRFFLLHMMEHYDCKSCAKHRQRKVDNLMLYVDLPPGSENRTVSLHEAVKKSLEPEERDLTCSRCKHDKHKVYTTFRACPKILMVQVNRYGMCDDGSVAKFNTPVEIPETLELDLGAPGAENGNGAKETFEPVCVIAHVGSAMDCGHYTSYVRHDDSWYHYNDLSVTSMSKFEALTAAETTAYVVFFVSSRL